MAPARSELAIWFEHHPDIVLLTATDGRITDANRAACEAFGLSEDEIRARGREGLIDPDDPRLPEILARRSSTGSARGEVWFRRADGTRFPGELSTRIVDAGTGADGECAIVVVRDVSERHRTESALRASEERRRALFEHLPAGVVIHGPDGAVLEANPRACEILGLSREQMRGRELVDPIWALLREDGSPMTVAEYPVSRVLSSGRDLNHLVLGIRRPDRPRPAWGICNGYADHDDAGRLQRIVISFVDITGRVEAEASLRESEERLRLVLRGSNDAPWDWDLAGQALYYSDRWWQMIGRTPGELPADESLWQRLLHPDDAPRVAAALESLLRDGPDAFEVEFRLRRPDGTYVSVLSRGFITRDAEGRAIRISGVNTDLTERQQHEAARARLEAQLRESQKMESIGTLAGGIAHDFNNLLGAILANVALARQDIHDPAAALESLAQIDKAAARARTLVRQILAFSRREPPDVRVQPLRPLVEEALSILRSTLPAGIEFDTRLSDVPMAVAADGTQLQQVVMNLCTNAWHALDGGRGRITVGLAPATWADTAAPTPGHPADAPCAHLWVADDGRGIDAATLQRVFEPFFTTKAVGQGTGLGLSVAHGIVLAHGGSIRAESTPGRGSCFHVHLPLQPAAEAQPAVAEARGIDVPGRGQTVVYVDDDEVMMHVVERLLQRQGYRTHCFSCSADALSALAALGEGALAADVVVSDYNMPGLSGLEFAERLRALRPGLPVVISSGLVSESLREAAARAGVQALVHKERMLDDLGATVASLLAAAASSA